MATPPALISRSSCHVAALNSGGGHAGNSTSTCAAIDAMMRSLVSSASRFNASLMRLAAAREDAGLDHPTSIVAPPATTDTRLAAVCDSTNRNLSVQIQPIPSMKSVTAKSVAGAWKRRRIGNAIV